MNNFRAITRLETLATQATYYAQLIISLKLRDRWFSFLHRFSAFLFLIYLLFTSLLCFSILFLLLLFLFFTSFQHVFPGVKGSYVHEFIVEGTEANWHRLYGAQKKITTTNSPIFCIWKPSQKPSRVFVGGLRVRGSVHRSANPFFKFSVPCWLNRKIWNWHLFRLIRLQCYKLSKLLLL